MEATKPMKTCGAKNRRGEPCQKPPLAGRTRCKNHGGASPRGPASPHWKTGRYSRALPTKLLSRYHTALSDEELLSLRDEVALVDARLQELATFGDATDPDVLHARWEAIAGLIEARRKLVESERKREQLLQQTLSVNEAVALVGQLVDVVRRHVTDAAVLASIGRDISALMEREARP